MTLVEIQDIFDISHTYAVVRARLAEGDPWQVLDELHALILEVAKEGAKTGSLWERQSGVWVGAGAHISADATILAPCIIGAGCEIRPNAYLRGNVILGAGCVIGNASEVKNSLLFDEVKAPHFNYIGDSVLGYRAHLGAGVILSNVRLDHQKIVPHWATIIAPRRKAGACIGDGAEIGCHAVINPGTLVGRDVQIPPLSSVKGWVV